MTRISLLLPWALALSTLPLGGCGSQDEGGASSPPGATDTPVGETLPPTAGETSTPAPGETSPPSETSSSPSASPTPGAETPPGTEAETEGDTEVALTPDPTPRPTSPPETPEPGVCGDGEADDGEQCDDGGRLNGDGCADDCTYEPALTDYDVDGRGHSFAVYRSNGDLIGRCWAPGEPSTGTFTINTPADSFVDGYVQVRTSRASGHTLVSWLALLTPGDYETRQPHSRLYDANCQPLTGVFPWQTPPNSQYNFDTAIDDEGGFVTAWLLDSGDELVVSFYSPEGDWLQDLPTQAQDRCGGGGFAHHVAVNPATGDGLVTCQKHACDPIFYRRFGADRSWVDEDLAEIPETTECNSSWYESHQIAMNDEGRFIVHWQNYYTSSLVANFYDADGALISSIEVAEEQGYGFDAFRYPHTGVSLLGGDYLLQSGQYPSSGGTIYRWSSIGELRSCDTQEWEQTWMRTNGEDQTWIRKGGAITPGTIGLSGYVGCRSPTCGDGTLDADEECDDNNLSSFDGCSSYCVEEFCGDGIVSGEESCDDANQTPGDGCDPACALEDGAEGTLTSHIAAADFDVAADGSAVVVGTGDGKQVVAACYHPGGGLKRASFPLSEVTSRLDTPRVSVSPNGEHSAVAWSQFGDEVLKLALLDGDCRVLSTVDAIHLSGEWIDLAVADNGDVAVVMTGSESRMAYYNTTSGLVRAETPTGCERPSYGTHVAIDRDSGGGVMTCQGHSGDVLYYRRFDPQGEWRDEAPVKVPAGYVWWYDGHTVGMNTSGDFVVEWRAQNGDILAAFYGEDGEHRTTVTASRRDRAGEGDYFYDSFRYPHQEIETMGADFILGEVFTFAATERDITYLRYTSSGAEVSTFNTEHTQPSGLNLRLDGQGGAYLLSQGQIFTEPNPM